MPEFVAVEGHDLLVDLGVIMAVQGARRRTNTRNMVVGKNGQGTGKLSLKTAPKKRCHEKMPPVVWRTCPEFVR